MSLFTWFRRKSPGNRSRAFASPSPGKGREGPSTPASAGDDAARAPQQAGAGTSNRKAERLERRELLYGVVRQSMTRAGVLSASYKFKVLSLDPRGRQYLIMMDLANHMAGQTGRLTEIEALIAQSARTRHDIVVTAVYWRVNEQAQLGLSRQKPPAPDPAGVSRASESWIARDTVISRYDPMHPDEVAVLRQVAGAGVVTGPLAGSGEIVPPAPSQAAADFADTERVSRDSRSSPLSGTQYGDLS